jgi:hypothetical protein
MSGRESSLRFSIGNHRVVNETVYFVLLIKSSEDDKNPRAVSKRYSQFLELYEDLVKLSPDLPSLPGKKIKLFTNHLDAGFIEQRRVLLETFMKKVSEIESCRTSNSLRLFLDTDQIELRESEKLDDVGILKEYHSLDVAEVWIPSVKVMADHTLFQIHCANSEKEQGGNPDLNEWVSLKRYQDFFDIDQKLRQAYPTLAVHFPPLPEKVLKILIDHNDSKFVEERRVVLENYLKKMIRIEQVVNDKHFLRFLNADFS